MAHNDFFLNLCQYYKGQEHNPDPQNRIWDYERFWVEMNISGNPDFSMQLEAYLIAGLRTFNMYDDTPITLKAVLFNRFMNQAEGMATPDDFKLWYDQIYIKK